MSDFSEILFTEHACDTDEVAKSLRPFKVFQRITNENHVIELKEQYPDSLAIAHPECPVEVQEQADMVGSTGMMARTVAESETKVFLIATELGMIQQLQKRHPEKTIIPMFEGAVCRQMKKHTLEKILDVLENLPSKNLVTVPEPFIPHIREILEKMNKLRGQGPATRVKIES